MTNSTIQNTVVNNNPSATSSDLILDQLNQRKLDRQQTTLNSAALQDHIMKSFNLNMMDPFKKKTTAQNKI